MSTSVCVCSLYADGGRLRQGQAVPPPPPQGFMELNRLGSARLGWGENPTWNPGTQTAEEAPQIFCPPAKLSLGGEKQ